MSGPEFTVKEENTPRHPVDNRDGILVVEHSELASIWQNHIISRNQTILAYISFLWELIRLLCLIQGDNKLRLRQPSHLAPPLIELVRLF